jgi:hypothetical protein
MLKMVRFLNFTKSVHFFRFEKAVGPIPLRALNSVEWHVK